MLEFSGEGVNLRKSAVFCKNLRFGLSLSPQVRHLKLTLRFYFYGRADFLKQARNARKNMDLFALALFRSLCNKRQLSRKNKFDKLSGMFPALVFVAF